LASPIAPGAGGDGPSPAESALSTALSSTRARLDANVAAAEGGAPPVEAPPAAPPVAAPPAPPVAVPTAPAAPVAAPPAAAPAAPAAPAPAAPAAPPAPPEVLEVVVPTRQELDAFRQNYVAGNLQGERTGLKYDTEAAGWVQTWTKGEERMQALGLDLGENGAGEIAALERALIEVDGVLKLENVKNDDYERGLATDRRRGIQADLRILQLERSNLEIKQSKLAQAYEGRVTKYRREAEARIAAHMEGLEAPGRILAHAATYEALWNPAYTRVGMAAGIDAASIPDFTDYAKMVGSLEVDRTGLPIADEKMETFLKDTAQKYLGIVDRHHRAQAATYARTAAERAAQPAPAAAPAGPGGPAAASPQPDQNSLTEVYKQTRTRLELERRA